MREDEDKPKTGRPAWEPTLRELRQIERLAGYGLTKEQIGVVMEKSEDSITKHAQEYWRSGKVKRNAGIAGMIYKLAMKGDRALLMFVAKTQMGWRETNRFEHTGANGGPIEHANLSDDQINERISQLLTADQPDDRDAETSH